MTTGTTTTKARKSRTFCCCVPVRAGVIIIALIGLIGGACITAVACINLMRKDPNRTANGILIAIYLILALVSLLGLVGAIFRKKTLIGLYTYVLLGHLMFSFALGVFAMRNTFRDSATYISECESGSEDPAVVKACHAADVTMKAVIVSVSIVAWLLEIWGVAIVYNYKLQLVDEEQTSSVVKDTESW